MFGEVLEGKDVVKKLEKVGTAGGQPSEKITIIKSGILDWTPPPEAGVTPPAAPPKKTPLEEAVATAAAADKASEAAEKAAAAAKSA